LHVITVISFSSAYDVTVPARGKELIKTDLQIQLPSGCYGRIAPRSGLALKHHIDVGG
jgi:dUTP pyrophosphatase